MKHLKNQKVVIASFFLIFADLTFGMLRNIPVYRGPIQTGMIGQQGAEYQVDMPKSEVTAEQKDQIMNDMSQFQDQDYQSNSWKRLEVPQEAKDLSVRSSAMFKKTPNLYQAKQDALVLIPEEKSQKGEREQNSNKSKYKKAAYATGLGLSGLGLYQATESDDLKEMLLEGAVKVGNLTAVKLLLPKVKDLKRNLNEAVRTGNIEMVKLLLPKAVSFQIDFALATAIENNNKDIIEILFPKIDEASFSLYSAIDVGNIEMVKLLLPNVSSYHIDSALATAIKNNNKDIIEILLPKIDKADRSLGLAVRVGNIEIVKLLLLKADLLSIDRAIDIAIKNKNKDIFEILLSRINDLELVIEKLKKIKEQHPELHKTLLNSNSTYKEAMILGSFKNKDWVIELLRKDFENKAAKTQTEQLFLKYYAKAPDQLLYFANEATKDKNIARLVGHYPLLSQVINKIAKIEGDDEKNDYVTFFHGRNWEWNYVNDVWNIILAIGDEKDQLPTTISMRQRNSTCDISQLQRARQNLVKQGVQGEHLVSSTNDPQKDKNEAERSEVTFMNYTGLSHLISWPECSIRYCLQNHSARGGASGKEFAQQLLEKYGLSKYKSDFDKLYASHQLANEYGELLTISVAKNKVDDIVYPARAGGYLLPEKEKALQTTQECKANIADINNVYLQSSSEQGPIFCAAALNIPGEGEEVCKIRSVNLADPEKYQEYENQRQTLFQKIKKDKKQK